MTYEVRCPNDDIHAINGVQYETCGQILGGIVSGEAIFRCPKCKSFVNVGVRDTHLELSIVGGNGHRVDLTRTWRVIHES